MSDSSISSKKCSHLKLLRGTDTLWRCMECREPFTLSGDSPPAPTERRPNQQQLLQDYFASHGGSLTLREQRALEDYALWVDDAEPSAPETKAPREAHYWVQVFWSPCKHYLVSVCISDTDISVLDDNGTIWEAYGAWQMSLTYIRKHYNVPAKRGARVRYTSGGDEIMEGQIVGSTGAYLRIRFDGVDRILRCHPTWQMEYLGSPETQPGEPT